MSEWISVDDRLPENGTWVLVTASVEGVKDKIVTMAFLDMSDYQGVNYVCWLTHNDTESGELDGVIGWKPLPEPMKKPEAEFNTKQEG